MPRALAVIVLLALLTGCSDPPPADPIAPTPSATPVFASDEEALAAAEVAYGAYQKAVDSALTDRNTADLDQFATGKALEAALQSAQKLESANRHQVGNSLVDSVSFSEGTSDRSEMQIYACLDVSNVDIVDANNLSVLSPERDTRFPTLVTLQWVATSGSFFVSEEQAWDGDDFCG